MKFPTTHLALCLLLFSCSAPKLYDSNRELLNQAQASLAQKQYQKTIQLNDKLVLSTADKPGEYQLQRFFAAYLNAQAHLAASFDGGFLKTPEKERSLGLGNRGSDPGTKVAHMLALSRDAGYGLDWLPRSASAETMSAYLPESLANMGLDNARGNLILALMTVYTRLGFENKISASLKDAPDMRQLDSCKSMLERTQLLEAARPWVMYMVFHYLRDEDEPMAFKFAAEALFNGLEPEVEKEMQAWIISGSKFDFICPENGHKAVPTRRSCDHDIPLKDFFCQPKT